MRDHEMDKSSRQDEASGPELVHAQTALCVIGALCSGIAVAQLGSSALPLSALNLGAAAFCLLSALLGMVFLKPRLLDMQKRFVRLSAESEDQTEQIKELEGEVRSSRETVKVASDKLTEVLRSLESESRSLLSVDQERGAAVTETVAAMTEIQGIIKRNNENLEAVSVLTRKSNERSDEGRRNMKLMVDAVANLSQTNDQLAKIVDIMEQISRKTEVIKSIVFKTQVLSFNASIEAVRAGQEGKGFAVVATEVGRLAEMSGKSSDAIDELLGNSRQIVASIVTQVGERLSETRSLTETADGAFGELTEAIEKISERMSDISQGARQQAIGVDQCVSAMEELNSVSARSSAAIRGIEGGVSDAKELMELVNSTLSDGSRSPLELISDKRSRSKGLRKQMQEADVVLELKEASMNQKHQLAEILHRLKTADSEDAGSEKKKERRAS